MGRKPKEEKVSAEDIVVEEKEDSLVELAIAQIEKQFGKGSIMTLGEYKDNTPVKHISSGSLKLDIILGKGGFAFGRIIEIYGKEGSGKSTLCIELIAHAQKLGLKCAYIDKEGALDPDYCSKLGVDLNKLFISQPNSGEEALSIVEKLVAAGFDIIIFDSIAAINPMQDLEKDLSENVKMAGRAAMLTRFFERNSSIISKNGTLLVCINQLRENLSMFGGGAPISTGGRAMKHYPSQRLELNTNMSSKIMNGEEMIGNKVTVKTMKNRLNVPYKVAEFDLIFGEGIDKVKDIIDIAVEVGVVEKNGTWFSYGEEKLGQGLDNVKEFFTTHGDMFAEIKSKSVAIVGPDWGPEGK